MVVRDGIFAIDAASSGMAEMAGVSIEAEFKYRKANS